MNEGERFALDPEPAFAEELGGPAAGEGADRRGKTAEAGDASASYGEVDRYPADKLCPLVWTAKRPGAFAGRDS